MPRPRLTFYYAPPNTGKSSLLIARRNECKKMGHAALVLQSSLVVPKGATTVCVSSRDGTSCGARCYSNDTNLISLIWEWYVNKAWPSGIGTIFVDEAQFLTKVQVHALEAAVDNLDGVIVECYGLRRDKSKQLFVGSYAILGGCDEMINVATLYDRWCPECSESRVPIDAVRVDEHGSIDHDGPSILIGDVYKSMCRRCHKMHSAATPGAPPKELPPAKA